MNKKTNKFSAENIGKKTAGKSQENTFYFKGQNFKWMLIGLAFITVGFLMMMGADANTVDGKFDPDSWNGDIFSIRRVRIAPLFVVIGFVIEIYAILKRNK